ncbi:MAG TPA: hypothetical protein VEB03_00505 [Candidatus Nanoarchaeia archaeon]|nr:hypothetical protein [Candidatus Nanoarchaeia archaeon]
MAGLRFDDAMPRVISAKMHGIIDYIHAGTNILVGALLWKRNKRAATGAFILGGHVLANALLTDYEMGVFRLYSFKMHGILDYATAATSAAMPAMLGITGTPEANFFYAQGGGESVIAGISDYDDDRGAQRTGERLDDRMRMPQVA